MDRDRRIRGLAAMVRCGSLSGDQTSEVWNGKAEGHQTCCPLMDPRLIMYHWLDDCEGLLGITTWRRRLAIINSTTCRFDDCQRRHATLA
jgi:hypothetical protein